MSRSLHLILCAALALPGCARLADSRLNPLNWFGGSQPVMVTGQMPTRPLVPPGALAAVADTRQPIAQVTEMVVERTPTGAILRATGLAPTQGWYNAQLVPVAAESGVLAFEFRVEPPPGYEAEGSPGSRTITVARVLDATDLAGIRSVRVIGLQNAREARR